MSALIQEIEQPRYDRLGNLALATAAPDKDDSKDELQKALKLSGILQTTLEVDKLIDIFAHEIIKLVNYQCISYNHQEQREAQVIKPTQESLMENGGEGVLIVDDLVDTGNTLKLVRDLFPKAQFATVYAKPMGAPLVDTFITEVSQDTWILFPWDTESRFTPPIIGKNKEKPGD